MSKSSTEDRRRRRGHGRRVRPDATPRARQGNPPRAIRALHLALAVAAALLLLLVVDRLLIPIAMLTPHGRQAPLSPLYALWSPVLGIWTLPPVALAACLLLAARRFMTLSAGARQLAGAGAIIALTTSLAMSNGGPAALTAPFVIYAGEDYSADLPLALADPAAFLDRFAEIMPRLSLHGSTHPPGFTLFLAAVVRAAGPAPRARAFAVILLGALAVVPLHALTRRRYGEKAAGFALLVYAATPSVLLFTATSLDALLPLPSIAALDCVDRARRGHLLWAGVAGVLIAIVTFLSFSGLALLAVGGLLLLVDRVDQVGDRTATSPRSPRRVSVALALLLAGFVAPYIVLALATGFDPLACFSRARTNLAIIETQMKGRGLHPLRDWIYATLGNATAFATGLGSTVVAGVALAAQSARWRSLWPGRRDAPGQAATPLDGLLVASLGTLLAMALSGVYLLEVERIWLFLVPPMVAVAAGGLHRHGAATTVLRPLLAVQIGQALVMEIVLDTFW